MERIINHEEYVNASLKVEELIDKVDDSLGEKDPNMQKLIEASDIVEAYEKEHYPIGLPSLMEVIRLRMFELKMKNKDLAVLLETSPARISEYLNGKREISLNVARLLHRKLNIDSDIILNG